MDIVGLDTGWNKHQPYSTNEGFLKNLFFASAESNSGFPFINASLFALLQF